MASHLTQPRPSDSRGFLFSGLVGHEARQNKAVEFGLGGAGPAGIRSRMANPNRKTVKFDVVKLNAADPGWFVHITFFRGDLIHINDISAESEAINWIVDRSDVWLKKYLGVRYV